MPPKTFQERYEASNSLTLSQAIYDEITELRAGLEALIAKGEAKVFSDSDLPPKPLEHEYASYVGYGRALGDYCRSLGKSLAKQVKNTLLEFKLDLAQALADDCESGTKWMGTPELEKFRLDFRHLWKAVHE